MVYLRTNHQRHRLGGEGIGAYNIINPGLLANGQSEDISQVLANFQAIATILNGGIDNSNIAGGAGIDQSKIAFTSGMTRIFDVLLAAPQASFDTNTILGGVLPTTYSMLYVEWFLRTDRPASSSDGVLMRINNDSGASYDWLQSYADGTSCTSAKALGATSINLGGCIATTPGTNAAASGSLKIPQYNATVFEKHGRGESYAEPSSFNITDNAFTWHNAAAITRFAIFPSIGPNFITGSRVTCWGLK